MKAQDVDGMNKKQIVECLILIHEQTNKIGDFFGFETESLEDKKIRLEKQKVELCRDELAGMLMTIQAFADDDK